MKPLREDQIWFEVHEAATAGKDGGESGRAARAGASAVPALFLDRDGVVVEETNYLHRIEDVRLIDGTAALVRQANRCGWPVVIVTNQAGIGRGYYGWDEFAVVNAWILQQLAGQGAHIDAVVACPFHEHGTGAFGVADHPMRKPNPGMLQLAGQHWPIDFAASLLVGDHATDLLAARSAGLRRAVHVLTGHGARHRDEVRAMSGPDFVVTLADSVGDPGILSLLQAAGPEFN